MSSNNTIEADEERITCQTVAGEHVSILRERIPEGGVAVFLASCGNIDHNQDPDREFYGAEKARIVACASIEAAGHAVRDYIARNDLGAGSWAGGDVFDASGTRVGAISYNGRFWDAGHKWAPLDRSVARGPGM